MCEFLPASLHACGHNRTRKLVHRCSISYYTGFACTLDIPEPKAWASTCHGCQTEVQREESWENVRRALREQSARVSGRERAKTRLLPLSPNLKGKMVALAEQNVEEAVESDEDSDDEVDEEVVVILPSPKAAAIVDGGDQRVDEAKLTDEEGAELIRNSEGALWLKEARTSGLAMGTTC